MAPKDKPETAPAAATCATRGPDLDSTKSQLDPKLYRQILLPNGLQCVLIQDTIAMHQNGGMTECYDEDESIESFSSEEEEEEDKPSDNHQADGEEETSDDKDDDGTGIRDAAVAILVGVGSMYDPETCQGLAHFLEHLLFMGSSKYPGENDYEAFVSKHGGSDNAYTEWEYTVYSLEIPQEFLWPALDRLAQFFVSPLLLENSVDRELLAIESEFQLHNNEDSTRWQQLLCATAEPGHPIAKFSWGNLRSLKDIPAELGVEPLKELKTFYDRYYYAANMRLSVIGAYPLDVMEAKVTKMFASVPALPRDSTGPFPLPVQPDTITSWNSTYTSPMADKGSPLQKSLKTVFRIVPVKDCHSLILTWPIPPQSWRNKPADFLAHILGHEAAGSLYSYFRRDKSWAESCSAGVGEEGSETASSHALFSFSFTLTEDGLKHWREMVERVYEYLGLLRYYAQVGWPEWMYEELQQMNLLAYRYASEPSPDEVADGLVEDMAPHLQIPPERLLDGSSLLFDFDARAIRSLLNDSLTPTNGRIDVMSSLFGRASDFSDETPTGTSMILSEFTVSEEDAFTYDLSSAGPPQVEPMFGTRFWCNALPAEWLKELDKLSEAKEPNASSSVSLPPKNPFVPTHLDLKSLPESDARHPLLNSSLKLCIAVGKSKQWFPATVIRYNKKNNAVLMSYEDEDEQWHTLDHKIDFYTPARLTPDFEGTMDKKKIKFRIVGLAITGGRRTYKDEGDMDEGCVQFPPIPPPSPADRLPKSICGTNTLKMWWLQDRDFHRPIADLRLEIVCGKANASPLHRACADLMVSLCADCLIEVVYLAELCELFASISATDSGISFRIHGFDDKLKDLLTSVLKTVLSFRLTSSALPESIDSKRFDACLEVLRRSYKNSSMTTSKLASNIRLEALRPTIWSANEKHKALENIDPKLFAETISAVMESMAIECLLHGNVDRPGADDVMNLILALIKEAGDFSLPRKKYPPQSVLRLPPKPSAITVPSKDPKEPNTAVEVYVQVGKDKLRERVIIDLLVHMIDEPMYDQIRTKDQFGYDVSCDMRWSWGIMGMIFRIVTNVNSADESVERINQFLSEFDSTLANMSKDSFNEHVVAVANHKLDMFNSLSEECSSYWEEIRDGRFDWQCWRDEAVCLRTITKDDALEAFRKWLLPSSPSRLVLVIAAIGNGENAVRNGRPEVEPEQVQDYHDSCVADFRGLCKQQFWGKVNSKLF